MFAKQIGIDLGTANVIVYVRGKGIVLTEPSVVALAHDDGSNRPRIVAVGEAARLMLGRTPGNITAQKPMRDGVIADYVITEYMLKYFIDKVCGRLRIFQPQVMICIPSGGTSVEQRAVRDAAVRAGAREAILIPEPLAAAMGANIPISGPSGNLIIDIGGGTAEVAVISLNFIVCSRSVRSAGNKLDEAIANFVRKRYNLMIGERTAEDVDAVAHPGHASGRRRGSASTPGSRGPGRCPWPRSRAGSQRRNRPRRSPGSSACPCSATARRHRRGSCPCR